MCDGQSNCVTGEDELACAEHKCTWGRRKCGNNVCIDEALWCNRQRDCDDASDEKDCGSVSRRTCSPFEFACGNGVCITRRFMCDFDDDCGDNSDETDGSCKQVECTEKNQRFQCAISKTCLNLGRLCDGNHDCGDGDDSDETNYRCNPNNELCVPGTFQCANGGCINETLLCNNRRDCGDNSDEVGCEKTNANLTCAESVDSNGLPGGCEQECWDVPQIIPGRVKLHTCKCRQGYEPDGKRCTDINECVTNANNCTQQCNNRDGSYACSCAPGFVSVSAAGGTGFAGLRQQVDSCVVTSEWRQLYVHPQTAPRNSSCPPPVISRFSRSSAGRIRAKCAHIATRAMRACA